MAPPPTPPVVAPLVKLVVRVLTFICLLIGLIILTTNTASIFINFAEFKIRFQDVKAYRYKSSYFFFLLNINLHTCV